MENQVHEILNDQKFLSKHTQKYSEFCNRVEVSDKACTFYGVEKVVKERNIKCEIK